jgi:hypothetical protein
MHHIHLCEGKSNLDDDDTVVSSANDFKAFCCFHSTGRGWVGWKNDTSKNGTNPVQIIFKFQSPREFSAVHIHTSNQFTKDIQVSLTKKTFNA